VAAGQIKTGLKALLGAVTGRGFNQLKWGSQGSEVRSQKNSDLTRAAQGLGLARQGNFFLLNGLNPKPEYRNPKKILNKIVCRRSS